MATWDGQPHQIMFGALTSTNFTCVIRSSLRDFIALSMTWKKSTAISLTSSSILSSMAELVLRPSFTGDEELGK